MSNQNDCIVSVDKLTLTLEIGHDIRYGSFEIFPGDFIWIKGHNGSGKSTFLNLFHLMGNRYFSFRSGDIFYYGEGFPSCSIEQYSEDDLTRLNRCVSFIAQDETFFSSASAFSYIHDVCCMALGHKFTYQHRKHCKQILAEADRLIWEYYEKYLKNSFEGGRKAFKNKDVREWSGGQQKMINVLAGLIKAQVLGLKLILMDEPLNNLDGKNKYILNMLINDLLEQGGIAILAITHCQIFNGVNGVLELKEDEDGGYHAELTKYKNGEKEKSHKECLETYNKV